ncbi:MAG TPA: glycosyltransferase family 4 protein [Candidatus Limnocylindria bacterium]|nr:glycosyltransferase family 4 protein [Candidatus Limnocylindria bacterium]
MTEVATSPPPAATEPPARRGRVAILVHALVPGDPRIRRQSDALIEAGYEVDVFALRAPGEPPEEEAEGLRIVRLPVSRWFTGFAGHIAEYLAFTAVAAPRLAAAHRSRGYDLVQVATVPDFLAFAALPLKWMGVPILLDLHEDMPEFFRDRFASPLLRPLHPLVTAVTRASAAISDELVTVHEPLRELSIERGVEPERIAVVMNGADETIFDPARHERRRFMADGTLRIIHHSNLQRIYGLDRAVEAIAMLRDELQLQLDVYGDGPWRPQVEAAIAAHGVGDLVTLHGRVPLDDLPGIISQHDLGIVPSLDEPYLAYSLSTKLLEYVAMGVPVIASDLATNRAHFTDAALSFVPGGDPAALADAIRDVVGDPAAAEARATEAQRQAASYAWGAQKARYVAIVDRLVGRA